METRMRAQTGDDRGQLGTRVLLIISHSHYFLSTSKIVPLNPFSVPDESGQDGDHLNYPFPHSSQNRRKYRTDDAGS